MTDVAVDSLAVQATLSLAFGLLLGLVFFATLQLNTRLYLSGGKVARSLILHLTRMAGMAAALVVAAQHGAAAILATFAGFLVARSVMVHWTGR